MDNMNLISQYEPLFGSWMVEEYIGHGSYGHVYKVVKKGIKDSQNYSAVKLISVPDEEQMNEAKMNAGMDEQSLRNYFESILEDILREIHLFEKLSENSNSNIITYHDSQIIQKKDGFGWDILIRMEYATPFPAYLEQHEMNIGEAMLLGIDIASALEVCEMHKVIHRDIKDTNIFFSSSGKFKLGDFGLAKELTKGKASSLKGSMGYMAPEVYKGSEDYDHTADIYSLGIVLYKLFNCHRLPFLPQYPIQISKNDTDIAFEKRINGEMMPPPMMACPELSRIILKACSYNPRDRYQSAVELNDDLHRIFNSKSKKELMNLLVPKNGSSTFVHSPFEHIKETISPNRSNRFNDEKSVDMEKTLGFDNKREDFDNVYGSTKLNRNNGKYYKSKYNDEDYEEEYYMPRRKAGSNKNNNKFKIILFSSLAAVVILSALLVYVIDRTFYRHPGEDDAKPTKSVSLSAEPTEIETTEIVTPTKKVSKAPTISTVPTISLVQPSVTQGVSPTTFTMFKMTDLRNYPVDQAVDFLQGYGFSTTVYEEESNTIPEGNVIRTEPGAGQLVAAGSNIKIFRSKGVGKPPVEKVVVPNLVGMEGADAKEILEANNLRCTVSVKDLHKKVIQTSPVAGTTVEQNTIINLVFEP